MSDNRPDYKVQIENQNADKSGLPSLYRVLMHNDDYTTMEFVVSALESVFHQSPAEAHRVMLNIHTQGVGVCGAYSFEVAETKVARVHALARKAGYPLKCTLDRA